MAGNRILILFLPRKFMCGRFTLRANLSQIRGAFHVDGGSIFSPRCNIAPTQDVVAVRLNQETDQRELVLLQWGLIPSWANDPKIGNRMINARAETIAEKPSFRSAFKNRRCLIVADGFYEWQKIDGKKQPYFIHRTDDAPFSIAGLWESWKREGEGIQFCTIITTTANSLMEPLHDRMPVILTEEDWPAWLNTKFKDKDSLKGLLRPCDPDFLEAYAVSPIVNNPRNETAKCVEPIGNYSN
jgi:putative SOS response-associated peptidase YedK